mmetsp:Transcript_1001/g.3037  ORF Transcript_1001/g.3037 Transcript_1001/m.3037 type:complete len:106 (-) Transcript_1001:97-414(-)
MFAQQKNLNLFQNKTLRVRRVYDETRQTLVYVAYSTRLTSSSDKRSFSSGRYKTSVCAIPLSRRSIAPTGKEGQAGSTFKAAHAAGTVYQLPQEAGGGLYIDSVY